jgi:hypothetical protein
VLGTTSVSDQPEPHTDDQTKRSTHTSRRDALNKRVVSRKTLRASGNWKKVPKNVKKRIRRRKVKFSPTLPTITEEEEKEENEPMNNGIQQKIISGYFSSLPIITKMEEGNETINNGIQQTIISGYFPSLLTVTA